MSIPDLLAELAQKGVRLSVKDENLKIQSPRGAIAPELRTELMERKAEILNFLRDAPVPSALKSVPLEEELNRQTIARLLEWDEPSSPGDRQIILNPREMAQHLTVTFRPLPEGYKNEEVLKFREDMEVTLREYGVNIQPWYRATTEIRFKIRIPLVPWKKVIRRRIVKANINALIDVEKPESWPKRLKGLATEILYQTYTWVLASGRRAPLAQKILLISWLEGRIFHRLENPFATQIITLQELDRKLTNFPLTYQDRIEIVLNAIVRAFSRIFIQISKDRFSIVTLNFSDSEFTRRELANPILNVLIPQLFLKQGRLKPKQFKFERYETLQPRYEDKLITLSQDLKETGLFPGNLNVSELIARKSCRDIFSQATQGRKSLALELIIYAEAPEYIGEPEISESEWENLAPVEGVSFHEVRQNDRGRWYLKARVGEDYRWKQIPDIWFLMLADDGTKSTVIRVGWQNKICIQIPPQTDANLAENLPINELREIIAIALSTALYKPELIENGAPIVRFPGYPKSNWFKPNEYYTGVDYPSVPCGTCESGILNFIGIYSLANQCDREVALVSLIKPGSGTTIVARNLDYLIARLKAGWKEGQIALGNENLADFEESGKGLASGKGSTDNPWLLLPPSNEQVKLRLFCFHASGCGASMYRTWAEYLPPTIAVCPIQLPGRETRLDEPLFTELSALARELAQALLPYLDLPFACFGHSMGALTSFEVVRQLRHLKAPKPVRLFVSSHRAPQIPLPSQPTHQFSDEIFIETLHHRFGSFPEETRQNTMLMRYVLPILRADLQMCETYTYLPEAPLDCPISAFGGLQDCTVTPHELRSWGKQTRQSCRLQMFPGGHFYFTEDPAPLLHAIAHQLQPILDPMTLSNSRNQTEG